MTKFIPKFSLFVLSVLLISACRTVTESEVKLVNGVSIGEDVNPFAFKLNKIGGGYCTASALTDRIAITNSHCLYDDNHELVGGVEVRLNSRVHSTDELLPNPEYEDSDEWERRRAYDLALVSFEPGTFSSTIKVASAPMRNRTLYNQIGYGRDMRPENSLRRTKQKGSNLYLADEVINSGYFRDKSSEEIRRSDGVYIISGVLNAESPSEVSNMNTASSNGDSGGPLFVSDTMFAVNQGHYFTEYVTAPTSGRIERSRLVVAIDLTSDHSIRFFLHANDKGWDFDF